MPGSGSSVGSFLLVTDTHIQSESDLNGFGPARRRKYILHYVIKGCGYYEVDSNVYFISAGQSFIIYPGETVTYYPDPSDPWIYAWVNFIGLEAEELLGFIGFSKANRVAPEIDPGIVMLLFRQLCQPDSDPVTDCRNNGYLHVLLSIYMKHFPGKTDGVSEELQQIADYINDHYTSPTLSVNELSEVFWISRSQLYREFGKGFGMSPSRYITQLRMLRAIQMFRSGERSVSRIAAATGFSNQFYFSKVFKKIIGKSPVDFRREIAEEKNALPRKSNQ